MVQDLFEIRIIGVSKTLVEILKTQKYLDKMNIFFQCGQYSVGISRIHWPMYDDDDIWNHPLHQGQKWFQMWQYSNPLFYWVYFINEKNVPTVWKPFCPQSTLWLLLLLLQDITTMPPPPTMLPTRKCKNRITVSHLADDSSACGEGEDQFSIDINWGYVMWVGGCTVGQKIKKSPGQKTHEIK